MGASAPERPLARPTRTMRWRQGRCPVPARRASARRGGPDSNQRVTRRFDPMADAANALRCASGPTPGASRSERLDDHGSTDRSGGRLEPAVVAPPARCPCRVDPRSRPRPTPGGAAGSSAEQGRKATRASAPGAAQPTLGPDAESRQTVVRRPRAGGRQPGQRLLGSRWVGRAEPTVVRQRSDGDRKRAAGLSRFRAQGLVSVVWKVSGERHEGNGRREVARLLERERL